MLLITLSDIQHEVQKNIKTLKTQQQINVKRKETKDVNGHYPTSPKAMKFRNKDRKKRKFNYDEIISLKDECLPNILTSLNQENVERYISKNENLDYSKF